MFESSLEKFHAQNMVDCGKRCVCVNNVVVYVDFVDTVAVVEHLTFVISPIFFLDFSMM